jgi:hypothetical protein
MNVCIYKYLCTNLTAHLISHLSVYLFIYISVCVYFHLSVFPVVYPSVPFIYIYTGLENRD